MTETPGEAPKDQASGDSVDPRSLALGVGCYILWGFFPLYFNSLGPAGALEVIVHRAVWGLVFCLLILTLARRLPSLWTSMRDREVLLRLGLAGVLVVVNWTVYVYAVQSGHTIDAALGYFINPLVTVALGLLVLHEKLTLAQKIAVGLGCLAVLVLVIGLGRLPWVSLVLALTFGFYSLVKKKVAFRVDPVEGLAIETATVTPVLLGYYGYLAATGSSSFQVLAREHAVGIPAISWQLHLMLLVGAGFLTMIPLLMFAASARGLPLGLMGLIQYIGPVLQLMIGILVFHEPMEPARWVGTGIIWLALLVLSADWVAQARRARRLIRKGRAAEEAQASSEEDSET